MKKVHWTKIVHVVQSVFSTHCIALGQLLYIRKIFHPQIHFNRYKYVDGAVYYDATEFERAKKIVSGNPLRIIPHLHKKLIQVCEEYLKYSQRYTSQNFQQKNQSELKKDFRHFISAYEKILACLWVPIIVDPVLSKLLEQELKKYIDPEKEVSRYQQTFRILTGSTKVTEALKARRALLKIAIQINDCRILRSLFGKLQTDKETCLQKVAPEIHKKITNYLKHYSWTNTSFLVGSYKTYSSVVKEIWLILKNNPKCKLRELEKNRSQRKTEIVKALKELNPSRRFRKIISLVQEIVYLRTYRLETVDKGTANFLPLLQEIARQAKLSWQDLVILLPNEILALLLGKEIEHRRKIKERKGGYGCIIKKGEWELFIGKKLELIKGREAQVVEIVSLIKGQGVCPGLVKGRVKKILDKNELGKILPGEILVTRMTTPDFIVAMEKAKAIITDLGGITCHAAIISRELGIPCIIGTKIATQVLKDGDVVEVDTEKGIVKVLNK